MSQHRKQRASYTR